MIGLLKIYMVAPVEERPFSEYGFSGETSTISRRIWIICNGKLHDAPRQSLLETASSA
jgi:hypothetical protein